MEKDTEVDAMKKRIGLLILTFVICVCGAALAENGLKPGDTGDAVLELNTRLRQLNYTTVRASDQYAAAQ